MKNNFLSVMPTHNLPEINSDMLDGILLDAYPTYKRFNGPYITS